MAPIMAVTRPPAAQHPRRTIWQRDLPRPAGAHHRALAHGGRRPVPSAAARARLRARDDDPVLAWVGTAAVTLLALFLRLWKLGKPDAFLFDETYYAKDAWSMLHFGYAQNYVDKANDEILAGHTDGLWNGIPNMVVHPEVGKWLIAMGEHTFGMTPFGWRFASAVVGSLMVMVMIRLARRVTRSTLLGLVAGLLMCFDGLQLVLSRLALLDIFVAFFVLCAVSCMVADRDWVRTRMARHVPSGRRLSPRSWGPLLLWRPWRLATGVFWGLALGTKWSALFPLAAFGILMWLWDAGARRSFGVRQAVLKSAVIDALPALGYVVLVPLLVYLVSWTGWLLHADVYEKHLSDTQYGPYWGSYLRHDAHGFFPELWQSLRSLWHYHHDVYAFHTKFLDGSTHAYQSEPVGLAGAQPPGRRGCPAGHPAGSAGLRRGRRIHLPAAGAAAGQSGGVVVRDGRRGLGPARVDRPSRLALRPRGDRDRGDLAALAALRPAADLQLLRGDDPAVPDPRRDAAARRAAGPGGRLTGTPGRGRCRGGVGRGADDAVLRLVLADLDRPADHQREWVQRMWFHRWIWRSGRGVGRQNTPGVATPCVPHEGASPIHALPEAPAHRTWVPEPNGLWTRKSGADAVRGWGLRGAVCGVRVTVRGPRYLRSSAAIRATEKATTSMPMTPSSRTETGATDIILVIPLG